MLRVPAGRGSDPAATIGSGFVARNNNFDFLRLVAAFLVVFDHSYALTNAGPDPLLRLLGGYVNGGALGVATFLVISGFLVTRSLERSDIGSYVTSRALRIVPALAAVVVIQTFVVGACFSTLPLTKYLSAAGTFDGLRNILVFDIRNSLPGVFTHNPYPDVVNGSLWTLPVECLFYVLLPLLFLLGMLRRCRIVVLAGCLYALLVVCTEVYGYSWARLGAMVAWSVELYPAAVLGLYFIGGAVLWVHRDDVPLNWGLAACGIVALFAAAHSRTADFVFHVVFPYLVLYAALAFPVTERWMKRIGDLSYGSYLCAFPIQQSIVALVGPGLGAIRLVVLACPVILAFAALSWSLIERPALDLKRALTRPQERVLLNSRAD